MEIGLRAKVQPEVDDRAARREAGRLRSTFEDSLDDLKAAVDFDDVIDRVEDMEDHVEGLSDRTSDVASSASDMSDALENFDMSALEGLEEGDFAMDVVTGRGPAGQSAPDPQDEESPIAGRLSGLQDTMDQNASNVARLPGKMDDLAGVTSGLGKLFLRGTGAIALTGLALMFLGSMLKTLADTSPLLSQVMTMFGLAMSLFFRPFGNALGQYLLPAMAAMLQLAAEFNRVFANEGLRTALGWLAATLIVGLGQFAQDNKLTLTRIAALVAGLWWIRRSLPGILRGLGGRIVSGLGARLSGAFGGAASRIVGGIIGRIGGVFTRVLQRLGLGGLARVAARFLPALGVNVVPVLGQILSALLWLDLIIDLLFGWSPIFDGIPALLRWMGGGIMGLLGGLWDLLDWGFSGILYGLVYAASGLWSILKWFAGLAMAFFMWAWDGLEWFFGVFEGVAEWFADPHLPFDLPDMPGLDDLADLEWTDYVPEVSWPDWVPEITWRDWIPNISWSSFVSSLSWLSYLNPLNWGSYIGDLLWSAFITYLEWVTWIGELVWDSWVSWLDWMDFLVSLEWTEWIPDVRWRDWVPALRWWSFISSLSWWSFISSLSWTSWISNLSWTSWISDVRWTNWIPEVNWSNFIPDMPSAPSTSDLDPRGWSMPSLATGGVVTSATFAEIGEGSEPEAVLPLSRLDSMLSTPSMPGPSRDGGNSTVEAEIDVRAITGGSGGSTSADEVATSIEAALGSKLDNIESAVDDLARKIMRMDINGPIQITADGKVLAEVDSRGNDKYKRSRDVTK